MNRDRKMTSSSYFQFSRPGFPVTVSCEDSQRSHKTWYVGQSQGDGSWGQETTMPGQVL